MLPRDCFSVGKTKNRNKTAIRIQLVPKDTWLICLHLRWRDPFWPLLLVPGWGRGPGTPDDANLTLKSDDHLRRLEAPIMTRTTMFMLNQPLQMCAFKFLACHARHCSFN